MSLKEENQNTRRKKINNDEFFHLFVLFIYIFSEFFHLFDLFKYIFRILSPFISEDLFCSVFTGAAEVNDYCSFFPVLAFSSCSSWAPSWRSEKCVTAASRAACDLWPAPVEDSLWRRHAVSHTCQPENSSLTHLLISVVFGKVHLEDPLFSSLKGLLCSLAVCKIWVVGTDAGDVRFRRPELCMLDLFTRIFLLIWITVEFFLLKAMWVCGPRLKTSSLTSQAVRNTARFCACAGDCTIMDSEENLWILCVCSGVCRSLYSAARGIYGVGL